MSYILCVTYNIQARKYIVSVWSSTEEEEEEEEELCFCCCKIINSFIEFTLLKNYNIMYLISFNADQSKAWWKNHSLLKPTSIQSVSGVCTV